MTPNHHALAREFVLLDNFYVDAEVSRRPRVLDRRLRHRLRREALADQLRPARRRVPQRRRRRRWQPVRQPRRRRSEGYIWDFAKRAGVSFRSYGEFADWAGTEARRHARRRGDACRGSKGQVHPTYPPYDLRSPTTSGSTSGSRSSGEFEANGELPRLIIMRLGNDHTSGTRPGAPTPRAMVAENDLALGRLVEAISRSRFWKESAIFVLEDDAQNGPDHVDAHRSWRCVISPYTQARRRRQHAVHDVRHAADDGADPGPAADEPVRRRRHADVQLVPDRRRSRRRTRTLPARVPLDEKNDAPAPGAPRRRWRMNFNEADMTPELRAERDPLEVGPRRRLADAAAGARRLHQLIDDDDDEALTARGQAYDGSHKSASGRLSALSRNDHGPTTSPRRIDSDPQIRRDAHGSVVGVAASAVVGVLRPRVGVVTDTVRPPRAAARGAADAVRRRHRRGPKSGAAEPDRRDAGAAAAALRGQRRPVRRRHPLRGARRRLWRRPDADRRDAQPDVVDGRDQPRWR